MYIDDVGVTVSLASGNCAVDRTLKSCWPCVDVTYAAGVVVWRTPSSSGLLQAGPHCPPSALHLPRRPL